MKVFISWSGEKSRIVAEALHEWIPSVIQTVKTWISKSGINAGERWNHVLSAELEQSDFGIICLTKENINEPWILFESGALAKNVNDSRVCLYLIEMEVSDIPPTSPLSQFQASQASREDTLKILKSINNQLGDKLQEKQLEETFNLWWVKIDDVLKRAKDSTSAKKPPLLPPRSQYDIIREILETVRVISRQLNTERHETKSSYILDLIKAINEREEAILDGSPADELKKHLLRGPNLASAMGKQETNIDILRVLNKEFDKKNK